MTTQLTTRPDDSRTPATLQDLAIADAASHLAERFEPGITHREEWADDDQTLLRLLACRREA